MIKTLTLIPFALSAALPQCAPTDTPPTPPERPDCAHSVMLDWDGEPVTCNLTPPQTLSYRTDDAGPVQDEDCRNHGGTLYRDETSTDIICFNIDY
jgi:hypothetical protein